MKRIIFFVICILLITSSSTVAQTLADGSINHLASSQDAAQLKSSDAPQEDAPTSQDELVDGNNEFAFDLYHTIRENDGNIFYSPYSISTAFGMAYAGARGKTEQQIANTFHYNLSQADLHPTFGSLNADLIQPISDTDNVTFTLDIANSLWPQSSYPLQEVFLDVATEEYAAHVQEVDYTDEINRKEARLTINDWISDKTAGKYDEIVTPDMLKSITRLVMVNAVYFKAEWVAFFEEAIAAAFNLLDGSTVTVPTMSKRQYFDYMSADSYQAVALPYKDNRMQMVVILPDEGQFTAVEEQLNPAFLRQSVEQLQRQDITVSLPMFDFETELDLAKILPAMCMPDAFTGAADFSGLDGSRNLNIGTAQHNAAIAVNESGTEAVGVTVLTVEYRSSPSTELAIDRPFIFFIHDKETDSILFMGRVVNPAGAEMEISQMDSNCLLDSSATTDSQWSTYLPFID